MKYIFLIGFLVCQLWAIEESPEYDLKVIESRFTTSLAQDLMARYKAETVPSSKANLMRRAIYEAGLKGGIKKDFYLHVLSVNPEDKETLYDIGMTYDLMGDPLSKECEISIPEEQFLYREKACAYYLKVIGEIEKTDRDVDLSYLAYRSLMYNFASDRVRKPVIDRFLAEHPEVRKVTFFPHINAALYCAEQAEARGRFLDRGPLMEYVQDKIKDLERKYDAPISCTPEEYDEVWNEATREEAAARAELESTRETEPKGLGEAESAPGKSDHTARMPEESKSDTERHLEVDNLG
jgi:hypothetical protein